jgi:hypothetical protein
MRHCWFSLFPPFSRQRLGQQIAQHHPMIVVDGQRIADPTSSARSQNYYKKLRQGGKYNLGKLPYV